MSSDPYVYPGTTVLKNIPGIRNQEILDRFEGDRVGQRSLELLECPLFGHFDIEHQERFTDRVAEVLGTLNAVHAFREGNGRTQREFVRELAYKNSYWINWNKVSREELYMASDASFMRGDNTLFEKLLKGAIEPIDCDRFPPPGARSRS